MLRAVGAFPCAAVIERATSEGPDKDDHPIAELNLDMAREATKHLPPTEVMAGAFLSRVLVPKNSSRYPLPPADDTVRYALAWQHRQMMEERSRRRNTALSTYELAQQGYSRSSLCKTRRRKALATNARVRASLRRKTQKRAKTEAQL